MTNSNIEFMKKYARIGAVALLMASNQAIEKLGSKNIDYTKSNYTNKLKTEIKNNSNIVIYASK